MVIFKTLPNRSAIFPDTPLCMTICCLMWNSSVLIQSDNLKYSTPYLDEMYWKVSNAHSGIIMVPRKINECDEWQPRDLTVSVFQIPCNILPADEQDDSPGGAGSGQLHLVTSGPDLHTLGDRLQSADSLPHPGSHLQHMFTKLGEQRGKSVHSIQDHTYNLDLKNS